MKSNAYNWRILWKHFVSTANAICGVKTKNTWKQSQTRPDHKSVINILDPQRLFVLCWVKSQFLRTCHVDVTNDRWQTAPHSKVIFFWKNYRPPENTSMWFLNKLLAVPWWLQPVTGCAHEVTEFPHSPHQVKAFHPIHYGNRVSLHGFYKVLDNVRIIYTKKSKFVKNECVRYTFKGLRGKSNVR
jgi:hypothetical protein